MDNPTHCGLCKRIHAGEDDAMTLWRAGWCRYLADGVYTWICDECEPKSFTKRLTEGKHGRRPNGCANPILANENKMDDYSVEALASGVIGVLTNIE